MATASSRPSSLTQLSVMAAFTALAATSFVLLSFTPLACAQERTLNVDSSKSALELSAGGSSQIEATVNPSTFQLNGTVTISKPSPQEVLWVSSALTTDPTSLEVSARTSNILLRTSLGTIQISDPFFNLSDSLSAQQDANRNFTLPVEGLTVAGRIGSASGSVAGNDINYDNFEFNFNVAETAGESAPNITGQYTDNGPLLVNAFIRVPYSLILSSLNQSSGALSGIVGDGYFQGIANIVAS